jgi:hypothetical protein
LLLSACFVPASRGAHQQDEPETAKDAVQKYFLVTESFWGRQTSIGQQAMISH